MLPTRFVRPAGGAAESANLYVANCGPAVGLSLSDVAAAFGAFGEVAGVHLADGSGPASSSASPTPALRKRPWGPGVYLVKDFVTAEEEKALEALAKRRVQHYGHAFLYETRNVDTKQFLGELPSFLSNVLEKIASFPGLDDERQAIDQLTVNEYSPGVGLSPHIDTHSAFDGPIFSLSLAGSCIMEFRKYSQGSRQPQPAAITNTEEENQSENPAHSSGSIRKAIFLPPRSMLVMSGEGRYAWHHYIPHHKVDIVRGNAVRRGRRRVSFTFRKVRSGPCRCEHSQFCDSQRDSARSSGGIEEDIRSHGMAS
ncbi:unnamed protein product [Spirodela intermedia]|uniref:Fe2OG dioxygenase domain-containing protein n=1 Tax=Spirodela intermedia TaxID=51605 RepID=A0A7I8JH86_SPIIN|nr:unnamed protein product [Spirodela intermedia]CAA6669498.1 unnamed protein product [Spirodela intermedia]